MNLADRCFVYLACLSIVCFVGYSIAEKKFIGNHIVECTVERVVDDSDDMPAVDERYERPYTIVSYQPRWSVFTMPGDLGEPGQIVRLSPPVAE